MTYLDRLRRWIPKDALPRRLWRRYKIWRYTSRLAGPKLVDAFARAYPGAYFIQVGSNDGEQLDPLRKAILSRPWRGIMIEPVPYVFSRLQQNYGHLQDRVRLENVAIAEHDGKQAFYHLARVADYAAEGLPQWYDALGSFRKEVLLKHVNFIPDIEQRVICSEVPSLSFASLLARNHVEQLDLLHTDVEGFDYELLKMFDFTRHRPRLLIFECLHLSVAELIACKAYLRQHGYETLDEGMDTWCMNMQDTQPHDEPLIKLWRQLRQRLGDRRMEFA